MYYKNKYMETIMELNKKFTQQNDKVNDSELLKLFAFFDKVLSTAQKKDLSSFKDSDLNTTLENYDISVESLVSIFDVVLTDFEKRFPCDNEEFHYNGEQYLGCANKYLDRLKND